MTKLKSFGCSFVYGDDLQDTFNKCISPRWSTCTWPALLSRHLKLRYVCHAYPGAGNLQILDSLLKEVDDPEPAVYVIGWTWIDRFDYTDLVSAGWRTIRPTDTDSASQHYYRQLHSQYRDKLTTLTYISTAISALLACGHKFIMTYQDPLIFETKWHAGPAIQTLQNYVKPHMTNFEGMSFLEWSQHHGHAISPTWHPLESAHRAAFEYIRDHSLV